MAEEQQMEPIGDGDDENEQPPPPPRASSGIQLLCTRADFWRTRHLRSLFSLINRQQQE